MNPSSYDVRVRSVQLYFLPVETRVPLKFGAETLTSITCARVKMTVEDRNGRLAEGWGETPLSVQWVWPSTHSCAERLTVLEAFCTTLTDAWANFDVWGHAFEIGHAFEQRPLNALLEAANSKREAMEPMPWLAALVCCSPFDQALHDAYGQMQERPVYETYEPPFLTTDLSNFLEPADNSTVSFKGLFPKDFLITPQLKTLAAWHLVGGMDPLEPEDLTGNEPDDGYPVLLRDWIQQDGLTCLKIKLRGNDSDWDLERIRHVGRISIEENVDWLSVDFNCTVKDPVYVNEILDTLCDTDPRIYGMILYVEQPFPYDLEKYKIDVRSVSARKPLFMDESCHDWHLIRLGRELGWTGVALKTCKTQTGALLSLCWAKAHGMTLMVQDLTNPMLAQVPHALLAAYAGTIMGVETNAMQFYPDASTAEAKVHPGLYQRHDGNIQLDTLKGSGFGYRVDEIKRALPPVAAEASRKGE